MSGLWPVVLVLTNTVIYILCGAFFLGRPHKSRRQYKYKSDIQK